MEIPEKLMKLKYYIIFSSLISLLFLSLVLLAPRFLTIVSYFWPLFVSTALFLFTVVFFAKVSPLSTSSENEDDQSLLSCAEKAGEGLLDYVAAPQVCLETIDDFDDDDDTEDEEEEEDELNETDQTPVEDSKSSEKSDHIKLESVAQGSETEVKSN
ncbi:hypothetical protein C5167_020154 [Papaver somniferum]|uniref:Transmembrane protein n=1 Tax=Papaver somniferum TaxID=3469 RepID=A0A4Y7IW46_PAPSO|nr:uncharacterized protein LOC113354133 [Papaver somniferum]RZC51728.1 hypothetical protein C5167_020154 [Papaver somniferum]